jgi:hypothetical protein
MKKLLTLAALVGTAAMSFGQGQISWNNTAGTLISVNGASMSPSTSPATTYNFGLFIAPDGTAAPTGVNDANWQFVGAYAVNSTAAAGAGRLTNPGTATIAGYGIGTTVAFIIRGWQSTTGAGDWAAALPGLTAVGTSALGNALLGGGAIPLPITFGTGAGQVGGFNITPTTIVPEPSSMVLAGLGAASLLLFRRRK